MTRAPHLLLGVDTGGTFTDAVLLDAVENKVVATAKALTTKAELAVGITEALEQISSSLVPSSVLAVGVSTTLATNAVVEGHGSPVLVLLVGFDEAMADRSGIASAFGDVLVVRVGGGHDHYGAEKEPLDTNAISAALDRHGRSVRAVAVASAFAVRNAEHEHAARDLVIESTGLPVTVSTELSDELDAPRRALTVVLNARLLSRITELIDAVTSSLQRLGVEAPVLVVKGDGSLAVADAVARRPIETILSGPAASMTGAGVMSGLSSFIVSDIGGTTTDVGEVVDGRPRLAVSGGKVGGWRTMVRAIDIRTTGLGGDSEVNTERDLVAVGPRRLIPLSLVGVEFPQIVSDLRSDLIDPPSRDLAARFVVRSNSTSAESEAHTAIETRILGRLDDFPGRLVDVASGAVERRALIGLAEKGHVQLAGFTPSDAAHVLGLQQNWSEEAAGAGAELMAWYTGLEPNEFCRRVWSETVRCSAAAVLEVAFVDQVRNPETDPVVNAAIDGTGTLGGVGVRLRPASPIVAVGGPAEIYYREVATRLDAQLVVPEGFPVANAVGAAAGKLVARGSSHVMLESPGLFRVVGMRGVEIVAGATSAMDRAVEVAESSALSRLEIAAVGLPTIGEVDMIVDVDRHDDPDAAGDEGLYAADVSVEARANPYGLPPE